MVNPMNTETTFVQVTPVLTAGDVVIHPRHGQGEVIFGRDLTTVVLTGVFINLTCWLCYSNNSFFKNHKYINVVIFEINFVRVM